MTDLIFFLTGTLFGCTGCVIAFLALYTEGSIRFGPKPKSQPRDRLGRFASTDEARRSAMTAALQHDVLASRKAKQ